GRELRDRVARTAVAGLRPPTAPPELVRDAMARRLEEPRAKRPAPRIEAGGAAPHADKDLLHDVLRGRGVERTGREPEDRGRVARVERRQRRLGAARDIAHEVLVA